MTLVLSQGNILSLFISLSISLSILSSLNILRCRIWFIYNLLSISFLLQHSNSKVVWRFTASFEYTYTPYFFLNFVSDLRSWSQTFSFSHTHMNSKHTISSNLVAKDTKFTFIFINLYQIFFSSWNGLLKWLVIKESFET